MVDVAVETVWERADVWIVEGHDSLSEARTLCRLLAGDAGWQQDAQDDLELVVSELVTNACRHVSGPCRMSLDASADAVVVEVWDTDPHVPEYPSSITEPQNEFALSCGGYGLAIVASLCERLEFLPQGSGGKIVRAIYRPGSAVQW